MEILRRNIVVVLKAEEDNAKNTKTVRKTW